MKFILGTKEKMTQIFDENNNVVPATIIKAGPMKVVQLKTKEKDGYTAAQFGFGEKREKNINKPIKGHLKNLGNFRYLKEYRTSEALNVGDVIDASIFQQGDKIKVSGISKAKGFQGVVKRYGFHGGPRTHGQKHSEREAGSIGATGPQKVFKGTRMAGKMGGERITIKNLKIVKADKENNQILISGAIPGRKGTLLEIYGN
ncbi:50S ribosomal protein L3 [Patescibacteria group bacterium]|nr:50S ribosomal protein L3 [Patescibacteria group bacterium]